MPTGYGLSHGPFLQDIFDRLLNGNVEAPISGREATNALEFVHALYASCEADDWVNMRDKPRSNRLGRQD